MIRKIILLACGFLSLPVLAEDWHKVANTSDGIASVYISDKIKPLSERKLGVYEFKYYHKNRQNMLTGSKDVAYYVYDCQNKAIGFVSGMKFNPQNKVINQLTIPSNQIVMDKIEPNSMGDDLLKYACSQFGW